MGGMLQFVENEKESDETDSRPVLPGQISWRPPIRHPGPYLYEWYHFEKKKSQDIERNEVGIMLKQCSPPKNIGAVWWISR